MLRDGKIVRTSPTSDETEASLIEAMLGRPLNDDVPAEAAACRGRARLLSVRDLRARGVADVSFDVRAGEIVGLAGLVGAGRTELARAIFGADRVDRRNCLAHRRRDGSPGARATAFARASR